MSPPSANRLHGRPLWVDLTILCLAAVIFVTLLSLGNWQIRRLAWKVALIEKVETRAFAAPVSAPAGLTPEEMTAEDHAYLRVTAAGQFRHDLSQRIKAVTDLGPGWWLVTPLISDSETLWINRGFLPSGFDPAEITRPEGAQTVTGLLRLSVPKGTLLERNDPASERWYSIDVPALSQHAGITDAAPYVIAADHSGTVTNWPRGGLTQVEFRNNHLSYALTWYAMALLFFCAMVYVVWDRTAGEKGRRTSSPS